MNGEELNAAWQRVRDQIATYDTIDESQMNAMFSRLQPQAMSDGFLMLTAENDFIKAWIEKHYAGYIKQALRDIHGIDYNVVIEVDITQTSSEKDSEVEKAQTEEPAKTSEIIDEKPEKNPQKVDGEKEEWEESAREEPCEDDRLSPASTLTFENFVIGESNRLAYSMAVTVAEQPGRQMLNPLFIYGKSGLGKTHLMRAIQNYITETRPDLRTVYVDSADFLSGYVEATVAHDIEKNSFRKFKNKYVEADVLLIDDIQFFQGKEQTLNIVFEIFNSLVIEGKQVVLSADRAPKNIMMDERYQSRFNSGGTIDIQPPEVETKLGIIKNFVKEYRQTSGQEDFQLPEEIERHIAEISSSNIRELQSAVTSVIIAMKAFEKHEITNEEVDQLLENHFSGGAMKKLDVSDIQKEVERYYGISHADLIGQKRSREIAYARHVAIYLCRLLLDKPYTDIAKYFGGRDHTTIMNSVTTIEGRLKESRDLREELENIKHRIREM